MSSSTRQRDQQRVVVAVETDLRRALDGDREGFRELAVYAQSKVASSRIMRALWKADAPVRPHREFIKRQWKVQASFIVTAFGEDLDAMSRHREPGRRCIGRREQLARSVCTVAPGTARSGASHAGARKLIPAASVGGSRNQGRRSFLYEVTPFYR
jgi:hypothetical protein